MAPGRPTLKGAVALAAAVLALVALPASSGAKAIYKYPNFNSAKGLQLNGSAQRVQVGKTGRLRLTSDFGQAGSAFAKKKKVNVRKSFQTSFTTQMHGGTEEPADGLTFMLYKGSAKALGLGGSDLGYGTIKGKSIAIELDIYKSIFEQTSNHVAVQKGGAIEPPLAEQVAPFQLFGEQMRTWIFYSVKRKMLRVYISQTNQRPAQPIIRHRINLGWYFIRGRVRAGFTAGTGLEFMEADVLNWTFKQR